MVIDLRNNVGEVIAQTVADDADADLVSPYAWCRNHGGYAVANIRINGVAKSRMLHRLIMQPDILSGAPSDHIRRQVDHINGDRLDNRRSNLRWSTMSQNQANRGPTKKNTSGFKGVSWCKEKRKWAARIQVQNKMVNLGRYDEIEDAVSAYRNAAVNYFGEYAGGVS